MPAMHPAFHVELIRLGNGSGYEIRLLGLPKGHAFVSFVIEDFDTPACRARQFATAQQMKSKADAFVQRLVDEGHALEDLKAGPCPFVHLLVCNVPVVDQKPDEPLSFFAQEINRLGVAGLNSSGSAGFYAPRPPKGDSKTHQYVLRAYLHEQPLLLSVGYALSDWEQVADGQTWIGEAKGVLSLNASDV
jgi:phosphatidylethanolamine-binding protein (PEBP) family uncharacterized protein